ncbi:MAG: carbohydrate-binding domain-containing protein [Oscillospiraceae bacterium]|nr:carbohydrate-binding domain-containing protein [Oscillospiraceae bacterium]
MKKALAVIISLSLAMGMISSCSQKDTSGESEVSVVSVSVPDELKADTDDSSASGADTSENESSESESQNNEGSTGESKSDSQSESKSQSDSSSQSDSESTSESGDSSASQSESQNTSEPQEQDNSTSQPTVTTAPDNSGSSTAKTTTTSRSNSSSQSTTTTRVTTTAKATTTTTTTALKPATTTHATAVTISASSTEYPEGAIIIDLASPSSCGDSNVSVSSGKISINAGGVYYLTGNYSGQIYIKTGEGNAGEADIDLYLAGVDISCSNGPAILCDNAKRFELHLVENTANVLEDGGSDAVNNGAIFSNDTIEIRGKGTLTIYGNNREGIASDDDIFIENGNIYIFSGDDGLNANDCITINGGYTYIEANGDGIDSKGTTVMSGGTVIVAKTGAAESSIESDSTYTLNGGTLVAIGGTGLVKGATTSSTQGIITLSMGSTLAAKTPICIKSSGTSLVTFMPVSSYSAFTFTCPELIKGSSYDVYAGGSITSGTYEFGVVSNAVLNGASLLTTVSAS